MIKTKFTWERSIIGCVVSFFIALIMFIGCGKDYDYDIDRLTKRTNSLDSALNNLQTQIAAIQANIAGMDWITDVQPTQTGYVIYFHTKAPITINHGSAGASAVVWQIGSGVHTGTRTDSLWYRLYPNGIIEETAFIAIPASGRDGVDGAPGIPIPVKAPDISADGYWVTYEWNASRNEFDETVHRDYPLAGGLIAYVTDDPNNPNQWLLRVKNGANGSGYRDIALPKNAAAFPDEIKGSIALIGHISSSGAAANLSLSAIDTSTFVVKYWYLESIYDVAQSASLETWQGQKNVRVKQLLTKFKERSLVLTGGVPLSNACNLKNSRGEALPLVITPVSYTGLLTKAENVSGGSIYLASLSIVDSTYAKSSVQNNFTNKFFTNAIYYLENEHGIKSNYSPFSISVEDSSSVAVTPAKVTRLVTDGGAVTVNSSGGATVVINKPYTVDFDAASIYDYTIADSNSTGDVDIYNSIGSFVIRLAGNYSLKIRKLHVDGKIYEETINVIANVN
jgi:hypothetical protein